MRPRSIRANRFVPCAAAIAALVMSGCTVGSSDVPVASAPMPSLPSSVTINPPPATVGVEAEVVESPSTSVGTSLVESFDPRRGRVPDMEDLRDRDRALAAMAVYAFELDTGSAVLVPSTPVPWVPDAPGYLRDVVALENGGNDTALQGFRTLFEADPLAQSDGAAGEALVLFENQVSLYEGNDEAVAALDDKADALVVMFAEEGIEVTDSSGSTGIFRLVAEGSGLVMAASGFTEQAVASVVSVVGEDRALVESVLGEATELSLTKISGTLAGSLGYGPLPGIEGHVESAAWSHQAREGDLTVTFAGAYRDSVGTRCTMSMPGFSLDVNFSDDGRAGFSFGAPPVSAGALSVVQACGRPASHLPAYFSASENRDPVHFLRSLPDLGGVAAFTATALGRDAVRYDLADLYQRSVGDFIDIIVTRFDLWLSRDGGWPMAFEVELQGQAEALAALGLAFGDRTGPIQVGASFEVLAVDDPSIEVAGVDRPLMRPPAGNSVALAATGLEGGATDVYLMEPSGHVRQLTSHPNGDEFPAISPDGRTVAFTSRRAGNNSIYLVDVETGETQRLTAPFSDGGDEAPAWSPNGSAIVFASDRPAGAGESFVVGARDLWLINVDGTGLRHIYGSEGNDIAPSWSPDGESIVFLSDQGSPGLFDVYTIHPDGEGITRITSDAEAASYWRPTWSPDGQRMIVTRMAPTGQALFVMSADGGDMDEIPTQGDPPEVGVFSVDGRRVVYADGSTLWSIEPNGSDPLAIMFLRRIHPSGLSVGPAP